MAKTSRRQTNPWTLARKITQGLSLAAFSVTLILTSAENTHYHLVNFPIRLSPLTMLAGLISSRTFVLGMTLALFLFLASLVFGRAWCGWLCPLGTLIDIFNFRKTRANIKIPEKLRTVKYGLLFVIILSAMFSNLTLLFFDPLTIFSRTMTLTILPAFDSIITALEKILFAVPFLTDPIYRFDLLIRPILFPLEPLVFQYALLTGLFFTVILLLNFLAERFWCRYICPLGALLGLVSKAALFKRHVKETCKGCSLCDTSCPTGTIDPSHGFNSDPSECTLCMNCLRSCRKDAISFAPRLSLSPRREYDPGRRTFINSMLLSVFLSAVLSIEWIRRFPGNHLLRPPGTDIESFSNSCIRCGLCMKVCPTGALQVNLAETGFESLGTPVLVPRLGFCQFSCNACGQICPVEAIPPLQLAQKQSTVIGKAYINHDRCIAWGDHQTCIVCEEMCPLPQKAITLDSGTFAQQNGKSITISLPVVNREICIGCGICENKCPVAGEAAIRVYRI